MDQKAIELGERLRRVQAEVNDLQKVAFMALDDVANARLVQMVGRDCPLSARLEDCGEEGDSLVIEGKIDGRNHRFEIHMESDFNSFVYNFAPVAPIALAKLVELLKDISDWEIDPPCEADGI